MGAFEDEGSEIITKKNIGVKLTNEKSLIGQLPKKPSIEEAYQQASEVNQSLNSYNAKAGDLALKFKKILDDKTLIENKTSFSLEIERELLAHLSQLAIDMNNDPNIDADGMGSVGLTALLLRALIIQRDRINSLEFDKTLYQKKFKEIDLKLLDLEKIKD